MRSNDEIVNIFIKARKDKGMSISELARLTGVAKSSISRYENKTRQFPLDQVSNFSKYLSLTPEYVLGFTNKEKTNTSNINDSSGTYNYFDAGLSAGILMEVDPFTQNNTKQIVLSDVIMGKYAGDKDIFISHVNGESMNRVIPNESLIAIKKLQSINDLSNGDIVVFQDGGDMSIKRFYNDIRSQIITFSPDSYDSSFRPINYRYEDFGDVRIIGRVVVYTVEI